MASFGASPLECLCCTDEIDTSNAVKLCEEHWWCHDCVKRAFSAALVDITRFPVVCCGSNVEVANVDAVLQRARHLLDPKDVHTYFTKMRELSTPLNMRIYCSDPSCAEFLTQRKEAANVWICTNAEKHPKGPVLTCGRCREQYDGHNTTKCRVWTEACEGQDMPYNDTCRIKICPFCHHPVELKEACNHIYCLCRKEWCFICRCAWAGQHQGCPLYGDPEYDAAGYDSRGLFWKTGRDRLGFSRFGFNDEGESLALAVVNKYRKYSKYIEDPNGVREKSRPEQRFGRQCYTILHKILEGEQLSGNELEEYLSFLSKVLCKYDEADARYQAAMVVEHPLTGDVDWDGYHLANLFDGYRRQFSRYHRKRWWQSQLEWICNQIEEKSQYEARKAAARTRALAQVDAESGAEARAEVAGK